MNHKHWKVFFPSKPLPSTLVVTHHSPERERISGLGMSPNTGEQRKGARRQQKAAISAETWRRSPNLHPVLTSVAGAVGQGVRNSLGSKGFATE